MRLWHEMCLGHMQGNGIKEKLTLIWLTDKHQLFPHSSWDTARLLLDWCAAAAGSSERLNDSMRCMKSFCFSEVQSTLNSDKLGKSWKLCRKKKKKANSEETSQVLVSGLQYVGAQKWFPSVNVSDYVLISPCLAGTFLPQTFNFL